MKKLSGSLILVLFVTVLLNTCGGGGGGGGQGGGHVQAPSPPPVSSGTLSTADYSGTQSPGDFWNWTLTSSSSSATLTGVNSTSTLSLGTLTVTDQANGYYALRSNNYSAFALVQSNFLWVLPVSGSNTIPPLVFNPIFAVSSAPCVTTNGTRTYAAGNFTNTASKNKQFYFMPPIDFTISGGSATISSVTFNNITINITGLTCSGGVWTGSNGLTVIASGDLLVGDLGTNATTGFPAGTTGFIAMVPLSKPSLTTLNQAHFVLADVTPTTADTANPGAGRFVKAGELGGTNTVDNNLYVYVYGGCQAASAAQTYPTASNTLSEVGNYIWSVDQGGNVFIQYEVPSSCGFGGTYLMYMGQLANGKLIGLPSYNAAGGDLGAPILIQE